MGTYRLTVGDLGLILGGSGGVMEAPSRWNPLGLNFVEKRCQRKHEVVASL
jgi:hypothetical protein